MFNWRLFPGMYFAPDTGAGSGDGDGGQEQDQETGNGTGGDGGSQDQDAGNRVQFTEEQQEAIDSIVAKRLKRAKEKWDSDAKEAKEKADQEAEQKRLKEQEEWQKLAEKHEARVTELEPKAEALTKYQETVEEMLKARLKELGDEAKTAVEALPGEPDALAKLEWLNANAKLFAKETGVGTPGRNRDNRRRGMRTDSQQEQEQRVGVRW